MAGPQASVLTVHKLCLLQTMEEEERGMKGEKERQEFGFESWVFKCRDCDRQRKELDNTMERRKYRYMTCTDQV